MRVGIGYDVHPLARGRRLVLGGIEIPLRRLEFGEVVEIRDMQVGMDLFPHVVVQIEASIVCPVVLAIENPSPIQTYFNHMVSYI